MAEDVSKDIRENKNTKVTQKIFDLANKFDVRLVCTLDAFCDYCREIEESGEDKGPLYKWTKDVITNLFLKNFPFNQFIFSIVFCFFSNVR